jgi:signal transduction histidine kinase
VRSALGSGGVAALVAVIVLVVARRALRPVETLTAAVRQMAEGRVSPHLDIEGDDEIATLSRAVGTMARAVAERDAERERRLRSERLALVGQMLAQVTHEVRNPLNALSLNAELLLEDIRGADFPDRESATVLATGLMGEIRRLEAVTERYLDLARRPAVSLAAEDPEVLARSVVRVEEEALRRAGVEVSVVVVGPVRAITLDGGVVRRALLNVLQNAAQCGAHAIVVRVTCEPTGLLIAVEDDGPGVPPEVRAHLFEPFFTTRVTGTGLGLAVARQSLEDAGGSLAFRPGSPGSVFEIRVG